MRDDDSPSRLLRNGSVAVASAVLGAGGAASRDAGPDTPPSRRTTSLDPDFFAGMYASGLDPWRNASSDYERAKYSATLASMPGNVDAQAGEGVAVAIAGNLPRRMTRPYKLKPNDLG